MPWARPGVGAVATQANAEVSYGPRGLELLAAGAGAAEALAPLLAAGPAARVTPGGDGRRRTAASPPTPGEACMAFAGDIQGDAVSCQANIMASERVWPAMLDAFAASGRAR